MAETAEVCLHVNGTRHTKIVEVRRRLGDFLREDLGMTGTHLACEQGSCGSCTVIVDGKPRLSCLTLAVQVDGSAVRTVEGLADGQTLSVLQEAFWNEHALQCGYCTSGFLMALTALLERNVNASDHEVEEVIDGVVCRCTGYLPILRAALYARDEMKRRLTIDS